MKRIVSLLEGFLIWLQNQNLAVKTIVFICLAIAIVLLLIFALTSAPEVQMGLMAVVFAIAFVMFAMLIILH
mgnify:CR=1 FL=1